MTGYCSSAATLITWTLVSVSLAADDVTPHSCASTEDNPYLYYGTATAYDNARNPRGIPLVPGCEPLQLWMVARHGSVWSHPSDKPNFVDLMDLKDEIVENHERGRGELCGEDVARLAAWRQYRVGSRQRDSLTPRGRRETYAFGLRVRQAFPSLFDGIDPSEDLLVRHTEEDRTRQSAEYFIKGVFGFIYNPTFPHPLESSSLLEDFQNCPAWSYKNSKIQEKIDLYMKGKEMQEVYRNVSERLGFNYDLPSYVVQEMYEWCRRERATLDDIPAWCVAFSAHDLQVLELVDDLRYYHQTGAGDRTGINRRLGCPLVRDMLTRFKEIEMDPDAPRPRGVFYFGDAETVGLVSTRLGLFNDGHHLSLDDHRQKHHRTFRTSAVLPWGANLMAVFYRCTSGERYRVAVLVSEHVVALPGCPSGLCPWSLLHRRLLHPLERHGCPLDICSRLPHSWLPITTTELWALAAFFSTILFIFHLFRFVSRLTA